MSAGHRQSVAVEERRLCALQEWCGIGEVTRHGVTERSRILHCHEFAVAAVGKDLSWSRDAIRGDARHTECSGLDQGQRDAFIARRKAETERIA